MVTHTAALAAVLALGLAAQMGAGPMAEVEASVEAGQAPAAPAFLRCEYLVSPLGVESPHPRLSWEFHDATRGAAQGAYRILVSSSRATLDADRGDAWDSGKVTSDQTAQVEYAGRPLKPAEQMWWKVKTWDKGGGESSWSDAAAWTMGLLGPGDWGTAAWIGVAGGGEPRVTANNGYHSELTKGAGPVGEQPSRWVAIDLGSKRRIDGVRLWPARPIDWTKDAPGYMFPMRFRVEAADDGGFAAAKVVVDRTAADEPNPGTESREYRFEPLEARYIRLTATKLGQRDPGEFGLALAELEVLAGAENVGKGAKTSAQDSIEHNWWSTANLTDGVTVSSKAKAATRPPVAMVRGSVKLDQKPARALLFATARGLYEFRINGQKVGDRELAPDWTDYRQRIQYQTYDVTPLLRQGDNVLGALIGDGWFAGKVGLFSNQMYGDQTSVLASLRLEMADGSVRVLGTGKDWKGTAEGPIRASDMLDGEVIDARREMKGWDAPGFDDSSWKPADVFAKPEAKLAAQTNEPIRVTAEVKPVSVVEAAPGIFVVDFGQNLPGRVRLKASGPAGTEIVIRHGEVLDSKGRVYTDNLRSAKQTDHFTLAGAAAEFEPRFTYHGFRYAEITGLKAAPAPGDIVARVFHSDSPSVGTFECSNPMLNRLMSNIRWTQYANMMSVPTDCPQRDERLGWMGDAYIFAQTGIYNLDMAAFLAKWAVDIREAQGPQGQYSDVSPNPVLASNKFTSVPGWGDAGVAVPWRVYLNYGDKRLLAEHYESAKKWIDYIRANNPDLIWAKARGNDYGDWLNGDTLKLEGFPSKGGEVPKEIFATVCFEASTRQLSQMAAVLGKKDEAEQYAALADKIRAAFQKKYIGPDGAMPGDTQAGYAFALNHDLAPESLRTAMVKRLLDGIGRYGGHFSTGFHSTVPMMDELVRSGNIDTAYHLVTSTEFPGWGFMIQQGATSMWERWDGYVKGRDASRGGEFQDPGMNSFNHFAFGAIGEWMFRVIGGIEMDPETPGWRHFLVRPRMGGGLTWSKASYKSINGEIAVSWKLDGARIQMNVTVPPNTWATVDVPTIDAASVMEAGKPVASSEGVTVGGMAQGAQRLSVKAGKYEFSGKVK